MKDLVSHSQSRPEVDSNRMARSILLNLWMRLAKYKDLTGGLINDEFATKVSVQ